MIVTNANGASSMSVNVYMIVRYYATVMLHMNNRGGQKNEI